MWISFPELADDYSRMYYRYTFWRFQVEMYMFSDDINFHLKHKFPMPLKFNLQPTVTSLYNGINLEHFILSNRF